MKDQIAAARGAIGILQIQKPDDEARAPWERNMRQSQLPGFRWLDAGGAPANVQASIELAASLSPKSEPRVFEGSPKTYEQAVADAESSRVQSVPLAWSVKAVRVTDHANTSSPNVVGILRGSDPKLRHASASWSRRTWTTWASASQCRATRSTTAPTTTHRAPR